MTRAQQAEEIVLLRNELAGTRKKLVKLESQGEVGKEELDRNEAAVPRWEETNGHGRAGTGGQETHVSAVTISGCGNRCGFVHLRYCQ
jgi:hypothetical protein